MHAYSRTVAQIDLVGFEDEKAVSCGLATGFFYRHDRIYIEVINGPFLFQLKGTPAEYKAGLDRAIEKGWLVIHKSGTYVKFTQAGAELFA